MNEHLQALIAKVDLTKGPWQQPKGVSGHAYDLARQAEADRIEACLSKAGVSHAPRPEWDDSDTINSIDHLDAYVTGLKAIARFKGIKLSEAASDHPRHTGGGSRQPNAVGAASGSGGKKITATEEILQAKGVNSLEELEAKKAGSAVATVDSNRKPTATEELMKSCGVSSLKELKAYTHKLAQAKHSKHRERLEHFGKATN